MREKAKRFLTLVLAVAMIMSNMSSVAYASDTDMSPQARSTEQQTETVKETAEPEKETVLETSKETANETETTPETTETEETETTTPQSQSVEPETTKETQETKETEETEETETETESIKTKAKEVNTNLPPKNNITGYVNSTEGTYANAISGGVKKVYYIDKKDVKHDIPVNADGNLDMSAIMYTDIKSIVLDVDFLVANAAADATEPGQRAVKPGDYIQLELPKGLSFDGNADGNTGVVTYKDETDKKGTVIPLVNYGSTSTGAPIFTIQNTTYPFTHADDSEEELDIDNMNFSATFTFDFNENDYKSDTNPKWDFGLIGSGGNNTIIPPSSTQTLDGVNKEISANQSDSDYTVWKITVGTNTPGVPLDGVTVTDSTDDTGFLSVADDSGVYGVYYLDDEGKQQGITATKNSTGKLTFTIPDDHVAPMELYVKSKISADAYDFSNSSDSQRELKNHVSFETKPDSDTVTGDNHTSTGTTNVSKPVVEKNGVRVNGDTIRWTIDLKTTMTINHVVVKDPLDSILKLNDGTLTVNGNTIPVVTITDATIFPKAGAVDADTAYYDTTTNELRVYFKGNVNENKSIVFETSIKPGVSETDSDKEVKNTATVEYNIPGIGPGQSAGSVEIGTKFNTAYIDKTLAVDKTTGTLTWTIQPNCRLKEFDTAVITDKIEGLHTADDVGNGEQEYIVGSLKIQIGSVTLDSSNESDQAAIRQILGLASGADIKPSAGKEGNFTYSFALKPDKGSTGLYQIDALGDVKITYQTKALDYFAENNKDKTYYNQANLAVREGLTVYKDSDSDQTTIRNDMLEKNVAFSTKEAQSGLQEFYADYTITVNSDSVSLKNVTVTDLLSKMTTTITSTLDPEKKVEATGLKLNGKELWSVVKDEQHTYVADQNNQKVTDKTIAYNQDDPYVAFGDITNKYYIHLRLKLVTNADVPTGDVKVETSNTANLTSDSLTKETTVIPATTDGSSGNNLSYKSVEKNSVYAEAAGGEQPYFTYTLNINGMQSKLSNVWFQDVYVDGLELQDDFLVVTDVTDGNKVLKGVKVSSMDLSSGSQNYPTIPSGADFVYSTVTHIATSPTDKAAGETTLTVYFGAETTHAYKVVYKLSAVGPLPNGANNRVDLYAGGNKISSAEKNDSSHANAWGSGNLRARLVLTKTDALTKGQMALENAEFTLYSDAACTTEVQRKWSGADGQFIFTGLKVGATYYYKETQEFIDALGITNGYQVSKTVHEITIQHAGTNYGTLTGSGTNGGTLNDDIANDRTIHDTSFTKSFTGTKGATYTDDTTATFTMKLYPMTTDKNSVKHDNALDMVFTKSGNTYTYAKAGTAGAASELTATGENGTINLKAMPWGFYEITEKSVKQGTADAGFDTSKKFYIFIDKAGESYYKTGTNGTWNETAAFENKPNELTVKKIDASGQPFAGATLELRTDKDDADTIVKNPITGDNYSWKTDSSDTGKILYNIPAGTYYIVETAIDDKTCSFAEPVQVTINNTGTVTYSATMKNVSISVKLKKVDQFGQPMNPANFELTMTGTGYSQKTTVTSPENPTSLVMFENGFYIFKGLQRGETYTIEETKVPAYFAKASNITITVSEDGKTITTTPALGDRASVSTSSGIKTTGYDTWYNGNFQTDSNTTLYMIDEVKSGQVKLTKKDTTNPAIQNKTLSGVTFVIKTSDGNYVTNSSQSLLSTTDDKAAALKLTTDENGIIDTRTSTMLLYGLPIGTYTFEEVATRADYLLPTANTVEVTVTESNLYQGTTSELIPVTLDNKALNAGISLTKKDKDDAGVVGGAVYGLYQGTTEIQRATSASDDTTKVTWTNSNGIACEYTLAKGEIFFPNVAAGSYTIKEITPASGYIMDETWFASVTITNDETAIAADSNYTTTEFHLKDSEDTTAGYLYTVTGLTDNTVTDEQTKIYLGKVGNDATTLLIGGADFALTPAPGYSFADGFEDHLSTGMTYYNTTDTVCWTSEDGKLQLVSGIMAAGESYILSETTAPEGYKIADPVTLQVSTTGALSANGTPVTTTLGTGANAKPAYTMTDAPIQVTIQKRNQYGNVVNGAVLKIVPVGKSHFVDKTKEFITIDTATQTVTKELIAGNRYKITEITTPSGYLTAYALEFDVQDDGTLSILMPTSLEEDGLLRNNVSGSTATIVDEELANLSLNKNDKNGNAISGTVNMSIYRIYDAANAAGITKPSDITWDIGTEIASVDVVNGTWSSALATTVTNPDTGKALSEGIAEGSYVVFENSVPSNVYLTDKKLATVNVKINKDNSGKTATATMTNDLFTANVELTKKDATSGAALKDATFKLTWLGADGTKGTADDVVIDTKLTDVNGKITFTTGYKGQYYLEETQAPQGYSGQNLITKQFEITNADYNTTKNLTASEDFTNTRVGGSITLKKVDSIDKQPIEGVEFTLNIKKDDNWTFIKKTSTNASGVVTFTELAWGEYQIVESKPKDGYDQEKLTYTTTISQFDLTKTITMTDKEYVENKKTDITLSKQTSDGTRIPLTDMKLSGKFADREETDITWGTTSADYNLKGVLIDGETYTLSEVKPATGYLYAAPITFTYKEGKIYLSSAPETAVANNVVIMKDDIRHLYLHKVEAVESGTGKDIPDAAMALYKADKDNQKIMPAIHTWNTKDNNPEDIGSYLDMDANYIVEEISAPVGYQCISDTLINVAADGTITTSLTTEDAKKDTLLVEDEKLSLKVDKVNVSGEEEIPGATICIYKADDFDADGNLKKDAEAVTEWKSDAKGAHDFGSELLTNESYVLVETGAPTGFAYAVNIPFSIDKYGALTVTETDKNEDGVILVKDAALGLNVSKTDITGDKEIPGATISLYHVKDIDENGNPKADAEAITSWTSSEDSTSTDFGSFLDADHAYVLVETGAPTGYAYTENIAFSVEHDGAITIDAEKNPGVVDPDTGLVRVKDEALHFTINKTDITGETELDNAVITIYEKTESGEKGDVVDSWTSKTGEVHDFGAVLKADKTYILEETVSPTGYAYISDTEFVITKEGSIETTLTKTTDEEGNDIYLVEDVPLAVHVNKTDISGEKEVAGATIEVYHADDVKEDGSIKEGAVALDTWTSEANGSHDFGKVLSAGNSYVLVETGAPTGYAYTTNILFKVEKDGTVTGVTAEDGTILFKDEALVFAVNKTDLAGKELAGAELTVYKVGEDGTLTEVDKWISEGGQPHDFGSKLDADMSYILRETAAPNGYAYASDIAFTIAKDGTVTCNAKTSVDAEGNVIAYLMEDEANTSATGQITVTKKATMLDNNMSFDLYATDATFYVALFEDAEGTHRISDVQALKIENAISGTAVFTNLLDKTYYVFETTEDGTAIPYNKNVVDAAGKNFSCVLTDGTSSKVTISTEAGNSHPEGTVGLENRYVDFPAGFYYSGSLEIEKQVKKDGKTITASGETFYAGIFDVQGNLVEVVELEQNASVVKTIPLSDDASSVTYTIQETDKDGVPVDSDFKYDVTMDNDTVTMSKDNDTAKTTITNSLTTETETETQTETTKKTTTTGTTGTTTTAAKTGDDTPIWLYVLLLLGAGGCLILNRKKKKA